MRVLDNARPYELAAALQFSSAAGLDAPVWRIHMITILIIVLLIALLGGGLGHGRFGAAGWSPAAIIAIILVVMLLTGRL